MLIRNYGHLWERKYINYGRGNVSGHLCGYVNSKRSADFREQFGIYVLYDKNLAPVYIGQAGQGVRNKLLSRLKQHETDHLWNRWEHFSWFGFRRVNKNGTLSAYDDVEKVFKANGKTLLNQIEGALITTLEPKLNKQGARWKDVEEFYQQIDEELEEVTNFELSERFDQVHRELASIRKRIRVNGRADG